MLNKKILAVAVAAAMSNSALAVVDIDSGSQTAVKFAQELAWGQDPVLVQNASFPLNATARLDFSIAQGTSRYIRYDLSNGAVFNSDPELNWTNEGASNPRARIARGGAEDSFVIFELTADEPADPDVPDADIPEEMEVVLEVGEVLLPVTGTTDIVFRLYEDVIDAISDTANNDLNSEDQVITYARSPFAMLDSGVTGDFSDANDNTASVDTEFTRFLGDAAAVDAVATWDGASVTAETANVGTIDVDQLAAANFFNLDGDPLTGADIVGANPVVTFNGDFSFGDWTVHEVTTTADEACLAAPNNDFVQVNANTIRRTFTGAQTVLETTDYVLCVDVETLDPTRDDVIVANPSLETPYAANRIRKGQYTATLSWDEVTPTAVYDWNATDGAMRLTSGNDLGYIHYDTITVEIPYITNFSNYNQRVVIVNDGPTDAAYIMEFIAEDGFTATPGSAAQGTVKAGTQMVLSGTSILDSVTNDLDPTDTVTRAAAKLYIDGKDDDIQVMIQTVNKRSTGGDGSTDTEVLNANSTVGKTTNNLNEKTPKSLD